MSRLCGVCGQPKACLPVAQPSEDRPLCGSFVAGEGGAHPWCVTCGWRWDYHPAEVERRKVPAAPPAVGGDDPSVAESLVRSSGRPGTRAPHAARVPADPFTEGGKA